MTEPEADAFDVSDPFIAPVPMEEDPDGLFPGDRGVLDAGVRKVLVQVLQRRFLLADRQREQWAVLLEHQQLIESRLNDLFVRLVVDHERGVAYKEQVRSEERDVPVLLRDHPYTRVETLVLVHLRTVHQRETAAGEPSARIDIEEVEQTVLSYFADPERDTARKQRSVRSALERLARDGVVDEESPGRYRIGSIIEIVLSAQKLRELGDWLRERRVDAATGETRVDEDELDQDEADAVGDLDDGTDRKE